MTHQTNAQRLAEAVRIIGIHMLSMSDRNSETTCNAAAAELRRLSAIEQERDQLRAQLAAVGDTQSPSGGEAVASIYVTEGGEREIDDWRHPLPVGRSILYTATPKPFIEFAWLSWAIGVGK